MTETVDRPMILPWQPTYNPNSGTMFIPLASGEWELALEHDGTLMLVCVVPNIEDGSEARHAVFIGETEHSPHEIIEGINQARNGGHSKAGPS